MKNILCTFNSKHLGKAFIKELREQGYEYCGFDITVLSGKVIRINAHKKQFHLPNNNEYDEKIYQLETQWNEALEFARESIDSTFNDGDWFAVDGCDDGNETWIGRYPEPYEYAHGRTWEYNISFPKKEGRKATDKEIEQALIVEAKRRGFKNGVVFNSLQNDGMKCRGNKRYFYLSNFDKLQFGTGISHKGCHGVIYAEGKWAEVGEPTIQIFDWDVEQHDKTTKIGCKTFDNDFLIQFNDTLEELDGDTTAREIIAELEKLDYINNDLPF